MADLQRCRVGRWGWLRPPSRLAERALCNGAAWAASQAQRLRVARMGRALCATSTTLPHRCRQDGLLLGWALPVAGWLGRRAGRRQQLPCAPCCALRVGCGAARQLCEWRFARSPTHALTYIHMTACVYVHCCMRVCPVSSFEKCACTAVWFGTASVGLRMKSVPRSAWCRNGS